MRWCYELVATLVFLSSGLIIVDSSWRVAAFHVEAERANRA